MATLSEALQIALKHHRAGRLDLAGEIYRRILAAEPHHAEAWHLMGVIADQIGQPAVAADHLGRAIGLSPSNADYHNDLGKVFRELGKPDEAVACFRRALELKPGYAEVHYNLGSVMQDQGKLDEAIACYRCAIQVNPGHAETHNNLGNALNVQGKLDEAIACYRRALELRPGYAEVHYNLGSALQDQGKLDEAIACYRRVLELKPDYAKAHINLGNALTDQDKLDEAIACYRRALQVNPGHAETHNNLGNTLHLQGKLDEAVACYRRALELRPDYAVAESSLICTLHFCPGCDPQTLDDEHRRWNRRHAAPLAASVRPHLNDPSPDRRLRIGYVSPHFRSHPVGRFLLPVLEAHDRQAFEIVCYSSVSMPDAITDRCRASVQVWRDVPGLTDEQLADTVRRDRIDVLVDLTMHLAHNRLLVFARKPAPVQVTYLAYCGTTGLEAMDYRLTDPYLDPPGADESFYSEESVRLPETYWCYRAPSGTPQVNALPAVEAAHVTFGCLNNFCKASPPALAVWCRVLRALPESRLLLHSPPGTHRDGVRSLLTREGISTERLSFIDFLPPEEYFRAYHAIDIALDPFPYGGGTTTCDALWMGVPVVSLAGQTAVGRGGVSILSNVGLPELVASSPDEYVRIAADLARNLPRLSEIRATLRDRMQASPLMDAPRLARNIEAAYRLMWQRWCAR